MHSCMNGCSADASIIVAVCILARWHLLHAHTLYLGANQTSSIGSGYTPNYMCGFVTMLEVSGCLQASQGRPYYKFVRDQLICVGL